MTWTLNEIAMVGAQAANFPNHKVEHWTALRTCVEGIREFLRDINGEMTAIENDRDLNPTGLARKRAELGKKAVAELDDFTKLQIAEHHVENRIGTMRQKIQAQIAQGEPKTPSEAALAGEIRAYIGRQQNPAMAAIQQKGSSVESVGSVWLR